MKRRHLTGALVFLLCLSLISALSACSITDTGAPDEPTEAASDPTPALPEPSADALSALRAELEDSSALFAVAYLGFMDMEPQGYLNEWIAESNPALAEKYPFMAQIPDARAVGTVGEVYCIVPGNGEASVLVELLSFDGMDYVVNRELYQSESGEPILLTCNGGAFSPDTRVTITAGSDEVIWYPGFEGGLTVALPYDGDVCRAKDLSLYENGHSDPYREFVQAGWLSPTKEGLKNTDWTADTYINGERAWLFLNLREDGTVCMEWAYQDQFASQAVYHGTWHIEENSSFLELDLTGPNGARISDEYTVLIDLSGENLILGTGLMGRELPCAPMSETILAWFSLAVG